MIRTSDPRLRRLLVVSALAPLVVFAPGVGNDFVDWDDNLNFVTNPYYRGLGWTELRWMLTATVTGHYIPVTWMTLGLDYVLWGMRSEEHTSELQSQSNLVCRLLLEKKKKILN